MNTNFNACCPVNLPTGPVAIGCPCPVPGSDTPPALIVLLADLAERMSVWMSGTALPALRGAALRRL